MMNSVVLQGRTIVLDLVAGEKFTFFPEQHVGMRSRSARKNVFSGTSWKLIALAAALCLSLSGALHAVDVFRVDAAATGASNGATWENAYTSMQAAVDAASAAGGGEVWVKAGVYTGTSDPIVTMKKNVALYGGFAGKETSRKMRHAKNDETIVDGESSRRCFIGADNASLDGFTIRNGRSEKGGGMYNESSSLSLTNCAFSGNSATKTGGGMYNSSSNPSLTNCAFSGNSATEGGGGMYNSSSNPSLTNCAFSGNSVDNGSGGGINNTSSSPSLTNCAFSGNSVHSGIGGGMYNESSTSLSLTNCTFSGNSVDKGSGGGMYNKSSSLSLKNCTATGNSATENGGGMCNSSSSPSLKNCVFSGNSGADKNKGGVYNDSGSSSPVLINCLFR